MKQIVDKLNEIARAIDESVELSDSDLIIDSLDSITKAYGGTPNNSKLIVDKLEDIANCVHGGGEVEKHYVIPEGTYTSMVQGELSGIYIPNSYFFAPELFFTIDGVTRKLIGKSALYGGPTHVYFVEPNDTNKVLEVHMNYLSMLSGVLIPTTDTEPTAHTVSAYYEGDKRYWQVFDNHTARTATPVSVLGNFLETTTTDNGYTLSMRTYKQSLDAGHRSEPLEVYTTRPIDGTYIIPFMNNSAYEISDIITSTTVAQDKSHYNVPTNEDNLAFIVCEMIVPQ